MQGNTQIAYTIAIEYAHGDGRRTFAVMTNLDQSESYIVVFDKNTGETDAQFTIMNYQCGSAAIFYYR